MVDLFLFTNQTETIVSFSLVLLIAVLLGVLGLHSHRHRPKRALELKLMSLANNEKIPRQGQQETILNSNQMGKGRWIKWGHMSLSSAFVFAGAFFLAFSFFYADVLYLGGGLLVIGICIYFFQRRITAQRQKMLSTQFPEALDLMVRGARVGVSAEDNIRDAAADLPIPIVDVFKEMKEQLDIGLSFDSVLSNTAFRHEIREFRYLASTLSVQRRTGGAYADVLENLSAVLREHQEQSERVDAITTEAKISAKVVAGVGVCSSILLFFQNRAQFDFLVNDPTGQYMAVYCLLSIGFGLFLIRQMLETLS